MDYWAPEPELERGPYSTFREEEATAPGDSPNSSSAPLAERWSLQHWCWAGCPLENGVMRAAAVAGLTAIQRRCCVRKACAECQRLLEPCPAPAPGPHGGGPNKASMNHRSAEFPCVLRVGGDPWRQRTLVHG
ncbi:unnamed protein product [Gadus morhua 'NCC']